MAKKLKIGVIVLLLLLIVAAVLGFVWRSRSDAKSQDGLLQLHGNVDIRQVSLAFDASGRVAELRAEEGQQVKKGDVLAVLDTRTLQLQRAQAGARVEAQEHNVLKLQRGSRVEEVAQARARVSAAQAELERTERDLGRLQGIASDTDGRGVSVQDLDRARSAARVARAALNERREAAAQTERGPRKEDIAAAQAQLKADKAQTELLTHQIALGELMAPSDGVVRSRLLEVGDMANPQRPVFALALTQPKWVRVYVSEPDLGRVRPGMAASVWTDSAPGQSMPGTVGYISAVAEFTPKQVQTQELRTSLVYEVRVHVDDPQDTLRLGQPATVRLALDGAGQP